MQLIGTVQRRLRNGCCISVYSFVSKYFLILVAIFLEVFENYIRDNLLGEFYYFVSIIMTAVGNSICWLIIVNRELIKRASKRSISEILGMSKNVAAFILR